MFDGIASRTPEGEPNTCPVCGAAVAIEPSNPPGDAPCPCCGVLLWFDEPIASPDLPPPPVAPRVRRPPAPIPATNRPIFETPRPGATLAEIAAELQELGRRIERAAAESSFFAAAEPFFFGAISARFRWLIGYAIKRHEPPGSSGVSDPWIA
jgi:hypothetical protein